MNIQLENFTKALLELENYLNIDSLLYYGLDIDEESYFTIFSNGDFGWAETIKDLTEQDGEYYQEEVLDIKESDDLTAILFDGNCGAGKSWIIFNNKNKIEEKE